MPNCSPTGFDPKLMMRGIDHLNETFPYKYNPILSDFNWELESTKPKNSRYSCKLEVEGILKPPKLISEEVAEASQANRKSFNHVMKLEVSFECGAGYIYIDMTRIKYDATNNTITLFGAPQTLPSWLFKYKGPIYTYIRAYRNKDKKKLEGLKSGSLETIETNKYWTKIVINN